MKTFIIRLHGPGVPLRGSVEIPGEEGRPFRTIEGLLALLGIAPDVAEEVQAPPSVQVAEDLKGTYRAGS